MVVTVPKSGVLISPVVPLKPRLRLSPLNDHRVIQEVIAVQAKLQLLPLPMDIEVLEQSHIGVEIRWPVDDRQRRGAVLADLVGECEAAQVDELVWREIRFRVARHDRRERNIGRAQQRGRADVLRGTRNLRAVGVGA